MESLNQQMLEISTNQVQNARKILLPSGKNYDFSINWLREIDVATPDFAPGCLHRICRSS